MTVHAPIPDTPKRPATRFRPRFCPFVPPSHSEGAGNAGRRSTRSRACSVVSTRVSHHGCAGNTRHSPRNGFNACSVLSPATGFFAAVAPEKLASQELDASTGASGPHALAVRGPRARQARCPRPPHPAASVRDVAQRPSEWGGTARGIKVIWGWGQGKFLKIRSRLGALGPDSFNARDKNRSPLSRQAARGLTSCSMRRRRVRFPTSRL